MLLGLLLGLLGVVLVAPLGARLLDPGTEAAPAFVLRLPLAALGAVGLAGVLALAVAVAVASAGAAARSGAEVLRDGG
ncbi:hypothetical protein GCM10025868_11070 [Angustibacter aerolatus]|uniref:ABC3 transporter permease protein domain-containing protein n=1 Tax=Angustibacter aerolatus TaxID=1162965 RepID=A0ABQ6JCG2_9ACTN|nr:hypothetical protein GCM10025868_11070 [Angustibacter aerolatus]